MCIYYTVYRTINLITKAEYIGVHKTKNLYDSYLGSGSVLKLAFTKYGKENFKKEILFVFDNPKDMLAKEAELVNEEYVKREDTYNLISGGIGREFISEETRKRIREGVVKSITEESRKKMSESSKGKLHSQDTKNKMSELHSGENNAMFGKTHSEETRRKISEGNIKAPKLTCPHCSKVGNIGNMLRWHFANCKLIIRD